MWDSYFALLVEMDSCCKHHKTEGKIIRQKQYYLTTLFRHFTQACKSKPHGGAGGKVLLVYVIQT